MEGVGAALMMPATASIITGTYEGEKRTFAFGLWTGVIAVAAAVGPILGGFLTTFLSWRYGFAMEVFIVLAMIISTPKIMEFPPTISWSDLDIWGSILSAAGIFIVVLGILQLNNLKNWYLVPYILVIGIILLLAFYFWQNRKIEQNKSPLLDINLLKIRVFPAGSLIRLIGNMGVAGIIFIVHVFLESVVGGLRLKVRLKKECIIRKILKSSRFIKNYMLRNIVHTIIQTKKNGTIPLHSHPFIPPTSSLPKILSEI